MTGGAAHPANRFARESSPSAAACVHNPVDWYPWGLRHLRSRQSQKKPIFLSIGYSSCFWCHVMERECFEDAAHPAQYHYTLDCALELRRSGDNFTRTPDENIR
ncbi:MAG: DUF255 domain-containing protein [Planctomycetaceae bacterium]